MLQIIEKLQGLNYTNLKKGNGILQFLINNDNIQVTFNKNTCNYYNIEFFNFNNGYITKLENINVNKINLLDTVNKISNLF